MKQLYQNQPMNRKYRNHKKSLEDAIKWLKVGKAPVQRHNFENCVLARKIPQRNKSNDL